MNAEIQTAEPNCEVSIIMSAFNGAQFVADAVRSVQAQTFGAWELLVIDDGSTDNTAAIVKSFSASDDRVRYCYQENAGQANARNTGIKMARGDLIAFLDQDDLWIANKLELQVAELRQAQVDVVFSNGFVFQDEDVACESMSFPTVSGKFSGAEMFRLLFIQNRIPVLSSLTRKECLAASGLLNDDLNYQNSDDYDLWLRLAANGAQFLGLPQKLVRYRMHSRQASRDKVKMLTTELAVVKKYESTELLSKVEKDLRFASLYRDLVLALVEQRRYEEARRYWKEWSQRAGLSLSLVARGALLRMRPGSYQSVCESVARARNSFAYRLGRPLRQIFGAHSLNHRTEER